MSERDRGLVLGELAELLQVVEASLRRSCSGRSHESFEHCDEWCKLWMLLAGSWYSLSWAAHSAESKPLLKDDLPQAHAFACGLLECQPASLEPHAMNPWFCGYFLISAEHRIANTIDRLTSLFFYPQMEELEKDGKDRRIYSRCRSLLGACPHCGKPAQVYLPHTHGVLTGFAAHPGRKTLPAAMDAWKANSYLARVYDRVNTIKHKKPDADAVSDLPTGARWDDAVAGVRDVATLMHELITHWTDDNPRSGVAA